MASLESGIGGYEDMDSALLKDFEISMPQEEVLILDTLSINKHSGGDSKYQCLALLFLMIPAVAIFSVVLMVPSMQMQPSVLCANEDGEFHPCTVEAACVPNTRYVVDRTASVVNWVYDFGLLCESDSHLKMVSYFLLAGFCAGALIIAPLADYFGRKGMLMLSLILLCLIYLKLVFTADVVTCGIVLCCAGALVGTYYCSAVAYLTEITTQEFAVVYAGLFHLAFPIAGATVISLLRLFKEWKPVVTVMSLVPLIFIVYASCISESPRLLAAKGLYDDARYEANQICKFNVGRQKHWKFSYEKATFMEDYAAFAAERDSRFFQHFYLLNYSSARNYLCSFSVLLFLTAFSFAGLTLTQQPIYKNPFVDALVLYMFEAILLFISVFIVQRLGHIKTIALLLVLAAGLGIASVLTNLIHDYVHTLTGYLAKLPSFVALVASVSFAAENCPTRVRATGLGMVSSVGVLGLIAGGLLLETYEAPYVVFGIVAGCGILGLVRVKEPHMYLNNDDIYEIIEFKKKNYQGESEKDSKVVKPLKETVVKEMKGVPKSHEELMHYSVKGKRMVGENEEPLGFESLDLHLDGSIKSAGQDTMGQYSLKGSIKSISQVNITKKYDSGIEIIYDGTLTGNSVKGTWKGESDGGNFEFAIQAQQWKGQVNYQGADVELVLWIAQENQQLAGLGQTSESLLLMKGEVAGSSKVQLTIVDEKGKRMEIPGTYSSSEISGEYENGKLHLQLVNN